MLTNDQIKAKIYAQGHKFENAVRERKWAQAKYAYHVATILAVFVELEEFDMIQLFGSRAYTEEDPPREGLFRDTDVQRAYLECIRANQNYETMSYPGAPGAKK